jgi:hypothetical protein
LVRVFFERLIRAQSLPTGATSLESCAGRGLSEKLSRVLTDEEAEETACRVAATDSEPLQCAGELGLGVLDRRGAA